MQTSQDERIFRDALEARTGPEIISVILNANQSKEASGSAPQCVQMAKRLPQLQQLIIRPGEEGGVMTLTEYELAKFCAEEKLKKRTSDRLISMPKKRDFVIEDIRAETIRELEHLIADCSRSKISGYDLWTQVDGKQEVKVYLRSLKQIVEGILADLGFRNRQYLYFEYREKNGERMFGPANGGIWWQITVRQIGSGHVLIAIVVFQDGSWVKMNLSCEPLYGEFNCVSLHRHKMITFGYLRSS